ncbi:MAG: FadR/GntR family transcriptional regulator [Actinomycetota bacterium]
MANTGKSKKFKLKSIARQKLSTDVANQVLKLIKDGHLKPGDRVPTEKELIRELGVSRTSVREGMQSLKLMGIIDIYPGQGTFVSKDRTTSNLFMHLLSSNDKIRKNILIEILELRKILEVGIVDIVARRGTEEDLKKIGECIEQHRYDLAKDIHPSQGDLSFHRMLAAASHNQMIVDFYDGMFGLIKGSLVFTGEIKENRQLGFDFHQRIYKGLLKRDPEEAKKAMSEHIDWIESIIEKKKNYDDLGIGG